MLEMVNGCCVFGHGYDEYDDDTYHSIVDA